MYTDSSTDPLVKDFKNNFGEIELSNSSVEMKMCVDAFENIDKTESNELQDEIECMEVTNFSEPHNDKSLLNGDLVDEIHCQQVPGVRKPKVISKSRSTARCEGKKRNEKIALAEKFSQCLLCDTTLESFSKLLSHITSKHFQKEVTNIRLFAAV